jgi:hypothetical protein|tara:strand:+ start:3111 stop:4208 length:1098 start_codon:yes stop_codon:yes gene_type:complete
MMSFNFKQYVRELLMEQTRVNMSGSGTASSRGGSVDTSNYEENPQGSGVYRSITGKDPYAYSIVSQNANKIVIKIEDAPSGRSSAIGRTFNITKNNLDDPNVQLLYSSLVSLGAIRNRLSGDEASLKTGSKTAEILIVGDQFNSINHFKEQHNRIKSLGHELRASTLTRVEPPSELNSLIDADLTGAISTKIEKIVAGIEKFSGIQVVSMTLEILNYQELMIKYMGKKDEIHYVHSEFQTDDTIQLCGELNEMIQSPPDNTTGESMEVIVDPTAEPVGETFQAIPGESDAGTMPGDTGECVLGFSLDNVLRFEQGDLNFLEPVEYCPTREQGLYTLNGRTYVIAVEGDDYEGDYDKPVFKTEGRQ